MSYFPYTSSSYSSSTSPYVYRVYSKDWVIKDIHVPDYLDKIGVTDKKKAQMIEDAVADLHKGVENLQEELFTRGTITAGDISEAEIEEAETPEEDLIYFDPKDLDIGG